jgi:hypothetical protein
VALILKGNLKLFFAWIGFLSVCPWSWAQSPSVIGELFPTEDGAHNAALLAGSGMSVTSGSQLSAGQSVASLILSRGGQIRICPQSSMSVNAIPNTEGLLLALDTGSLEINYPINVLTDTLITPDFKLQLVGPGTFHFALGFNNRGDTCVRSLRGNTSGIIVSESMGTGTYQVKPDEQVLFAKGKLGDHFSSGIDCGCPAPQPPVLRAQENPEANPTAELPPQKADDVRVKVDVPLVFRGNTGNAAGTAPEPEPTYMPAKIQFSTLPDVFTLQATMEPWDPVPAKKAPVSTEKREKKGFFARLKGFFASIFHR